jgi:hypothetical protein
MLTLSLLTWRIWRASNNANRWQMGFNSVFRGLIEGADIVRFINTYPANVENNTSRWQMGFKSMFKGLKSSNKFPPNLGISKKKNISAGHKTKRELIRYRIKYFFLRNSHQ